MSNTTMSDAKVTIKQWPRVLALLWKLMKPPRRTLLYSPAGTGKTNYACSLQPDYERVTMTPAMFPDSLFGKFLLKDGSTHWVNGVAARAADRGVLLVLDEIHKASGEMDATLQSVLDDETVCALNLDNGETIIPKEGYKIIATMNGSPDQLGDAVLDRFDCVLNCRMPHEGIFKRLNPASAAFLLNKIQNEPDTDIYVPKISPRLMIAYDNLVNQGFDEELAGEVIFGEGQGKSVRMAMVEALRNGSVKAWKQFACGNLRLKHKRRNASKRKGRK